MVACRCGRLPRCGGSAFRFGLGSISMAGVEQAIAWQAHIGGFLAGLLAFAAFDPIPISTGGGPNGGMDAPPPSAQS